MFQSVYGVDAFFPVKSQKLFQKFNSPRSISKTMLVSRDIFIPGVGIRESTYLPKRRLKSPGRCRGLIASAPGSCLKPGIFSSVGVPQRSKMISN